MSLATRLSAFFLVALALVLAGFSGDPVPAGADLPGRAARRAAATRPGHARGVGGHRAGRARMGAGRPPDDAGRRARDRRRALGGPRRPRRAWSTTRPTRARATSPPAGRRRPGRRTRPTGRSSARSPGGDWRRGGSELAELLRQGRGHPDDEPGYEVQYPSWSWSSAWRRPPWRRRWAGWA